VAPDSQPSSFGLGFRTWRETDPLGDHEWPPRPWRCATRSQSRFLNELPALDGLPCSTSWHSSECSQPIPTRPSGSITVETLTALKARWKRRRERRSSSAGEWSRSSRRAGTSEESRLQPLIVKYVFGPRDVARNHLPGSPPPASMLCQRRSRPTSRLHSASANLDDQADRPTQRSWSRR
jgi:hypothetical protein